jgi:hypothetical protein
MQNGLPDLGKLNSVHRPSAAKLLVLAVIALGLLMPVLLGVLLTVDAIIVIDSGSKEDAFNRVSGPLILLAVSSPFFAYTGFVLRKEYRKWAATKTIRLTIYQRGFTYEEKGRRETCTWDEVTDSTHRIVMIHSRASAPRRASLIRSIVTRDGAMISLAETLDLMKVTSLINAARSEYSTRYETEPTCSSSPP